MQRPYYRGRPIGSVTALARTLRVSEEALRRFAEEASAYYGDCGKALKRDGSPRVVFSVRQPLKLIQKRIKSAILDRVFYPTYIQGGIRDSESPRDYISNARLHSKSGTLINEDIAEFFRSVSCDAVLDIWMRFFNFPWEVATILTGLTTKDGSLVLGASTSCHLANLAFWRSETGLAMKFAQRGYRFSRFIDDICVSSRRELLAEEKAEIVGAIRRMVSAADLRLKTKKHKVCSRGQRMLVNNLVVNARVSIQGKERSRIRAAVRQCEMLAVSRPLATEFGQLLRATEGRVRHLERLHPTEGKRLRERLTNLYVARGRA